LCLTTRYVSIASIAGSLCIPIMAFVLPHARRSAWVPTVLIVIPAIVIAKHHGNIRRLLNGTEFRFGSPKQHTPEPAA
jgi:glycerol-3-phosphate acyltransferase PlsY